MLRLNKTESARNRARRLRREMSIGERVFWKTVRKDRLGYRVRRQVPIGPYVLDFYIPKPKLCIEIDGEQHARRTASDAERDALLTAQGVLTVRLASLSLFEARRHETPFWVEEIVRLCQERAKKCES